MPVEQDPPDPPELTLRVGVTGARKLTRDGLPALRHRAGEVLGRIATRLEELSTQLSARFTYAQCPPLLRLISPLAEGADRLVAEEALAVGYRLEVPLPFTQAEYERDFPDSVSEFRTLLARAGARVLRLPGARGESEAASYEAVGRVVVRNADVVIAIWNGLAARGRGGTAEIVTFAAQRGVPVCWLPTDGGAMRWIGTMNDLPENSADLPTGEAAFTRLSGWLAEEVLSGRDPVSCIVRARLRASTLKERA